PASPRKGSKRRWSPSPLSSLASASSPFSPCCCASHSQSSSIIRTKGHFALVRKTDPTRPLNRNWQSRQRHIDAVAAQRILEHRGNRRSFCRCGNAREFVDLRRIPFLAVPSDLALIRSRWDAVSALQQ